MRTDSPRAFIVCDLGFGDAGKGLVTDALVRRSGARLVVRYNGGAQAGHNVVTPEGRHHTFAQLGAGSFVPGVRTFLSRYVLVHPTALLLEARNFDAKNGGDVLSRVGVSEEARLITPFHQATNRLRELARGGARHGSCGVGVGETVQDELAHPEDTLRAGDLRAPAAAATRRKLERVRARKHQEALALLERCEDRASALREFAFFEHPELSTRWLEQSGELEARGCIVEDRTLTRWGQASSVVFEGAQGVLLDEGIGFHPHTTWSDCTPRQAQALGEEFLPGLEPVKIGVLRSHAVRHGAGPLPTETETLAPLLREHNAPNDWQGPVRYGWLDAVLGRYALERSGGVDLLALTHVDLLRRAGGLQGAAAYRSSHDSGFWHPGEAGRRLRVPAEPSLEAQQALGEWLGRGVEPVLSALPDEASLLEWVERELGRPVGLSSRGPRANDVRFEGFP